MMRRAQPWLGTLVEVTVADEHEHLDERARNRCFDHAFAAVAEVHRLMSFHDAGSDVSRINRAAPGESIEVHPATWEVLDCALSLARESAGLFDIGCAPALVEWGYLPSLPGVSPRPTRADRVLTLASDSRVEKNAALWIDLGGIAKGYAVDAAVAALIEAGAQSGCVNAGGDLRVFGNMDIPVLVRDPACPTEAGLQLTLHDEALATSATYFSGRRVDGTMRSALVDVRHARAVTTADSASVRAPCCMIADALTKVVLVSGNPSHAVLRRHGATALLL